jgi:two-component system, OmpR family, sensor histidine kinase ArlS
MTLRRRLFFVYVSLLLVIQLGLSAAIYIIYSQYREEVFYDRLENRILLITRLMFEVREMDAQLTRAFDRSTIHSLYDEKVIVFDVNNEVVYSSIDDARVEYTPEVLRQIREEGEWRERDGEKEVLGLHYKHDGNDYVALATAHDKHGLAMIDNLLRTLGISFVISVLLSAVTGRFVISKTLKPVQELNDNISRIGPHNLNERLEVSDGTDELGRIATSFNVMLERLQEAFEQQQNFIHFASHELNTPLAVNHALLEKLKNTSPSNHDYKTAVDELLEVEQRLTELLASLLMLSSLENIRAHTTHHVVRIDELLFEAADECALVRPQLRIELDISADIQEESHLQTSGIAPLLRTAFKNIIENAWKYSSDKRVLCSIQSNADAVTVTFSNLGDPIPENARVQIFRPFFRNASTTSSGQGLGLAIVERIVSLHGGTITYKWHNEAGNQFEVSLPRV